MHVHWFSNFRLDLLVLVLDYFLKNINYSNEHIAVFLNFYTKDT